MVEVQKSIGGNSDSVDILKTTVQAVQDAGLPPVIAPGGMSRARRQYLHKEIRPFVQEQFRDDLCPPVSD